MIAFFLYFSFFKAPFQQRYHAQILACAIVKEQTHLVVGCRVHDRPFESRQRQRSGTVILYGEAPDLRNRGFPRTVELICYSTPVHHSIKAGLIVGWFER